MRQSPFNNPAMPLLLRLVVLVAWLLLLAAGMSLLGMPDFARSRWAWTLTPLNAGFLGAIYLSAIVPLTVLLVTNRWAPARLVLPMLWVFTTVILVVSCLYLDRFQWQRRLTGIWFGIYTVLPIAATYYLWRYRRLPPANSIPISPAVQAYLRLQAIVLGCYGAGLLLVPTWINHSWTWKLDAFHSQLYSAIFLTGAVGAWIVSATTAAVELFTLGLTQTCLGGFALWGVIRVDMAVRKIPWGLPTTWLWLGLFVVLTMAGLGLIGHSLRWQQAKVR